MYADSDVVRENSHIDPDDQLSLRIRKMIKHGLGTPVMLAGLHRLMPAVERVLKPERLLHRLYTAVISVHHLRGFRAGHASCGTRVGTGRST
jgi:hypothetical protein